MTDEQGYAMWGTWLAIGTAIEVYALTTGKVTPLTRFLVWVTGHNQRWEPVGETALLVLGLLGWKHVKDYC